MTFIDFFKSQFSDKLTHAQKREKCTICKCKSSKKSPVRKHKCCNTFTCYECFDAWYQSKIYHNTIDCYVCTRKYNLQLNEIDHIIDSDESITTVRGFTRADLANWLGSNRVNLRFVETASP